MNKTHLIGIFLLFVLICIWQGEVFQMEKIEIFQSLFFLSLEILITYTLVEYAIKKIDEQGKKSIRGKIYKMLCSYFNDYVMSIHSLFSKAIDIPIGLSIRKSDNSDLVPFSKKLIDYILNEIELKREEMKEFNYSDFNLDTKRLGEKIEYIIEIFNGVIEPKYLELLIDLIDNISMLRKDLTNDIERHKNEKINGFAYDYTVNRFNTIFSLIIKQSDKKFWDI